MAATPLSYFWASVTQGSADAYAQASITTGLLGLSGTAYQIREIVAEFPKIGTLAGVNHELQLGIKSLAAMSGSAIADKTVLWRHVKSSTMATSGLGTWDQTVRTLFDDNAPLFMVNDPIYLQCDSNATTAANTYYVRIGFQSVKLSDVLRLQSALSSLS